MIMNVQSSVLDNGVQVITSSIPRVESVTVGIWVAVGARHESNRQAGISHFLEHLLFKGTRRRSAIDISRAIEGTGGYLNAFTQEESTCYYARVVADQTWTALDVLADMVLHPCLATGDIEKECGVILEEIAMYQDQPQHLVQDMLGRALWLDHPLGRPIIGLAASLKRMNRAELCRFRQRMYRPNGTIVALAGKVDHDDCVKAVRRLLGRIPRQRVQPFQPVMRSTAHEPVSLMAKDIEQMQLAVGFRHFGRHDGRRYHLRILNAVLGENMSSRLFQTVREQHGLAYSIHSSFQLLADTGAWIVGAGLDRKQTHKALGLIIREIEKVRRQTIPADEFRRARDYAIGQLKLSLESTTHHMMCLGEHLLSYGRFLSPEEAIRKLEAVTPADVQDLAAVLFRPERCSVAMIGPGLTPKDGAWIQDTVNRLK